jgi:DNA-binding NtrC family response regulator
MVAVATIMTFVCISSADPTSPKLLRLLDGVDAEMTGPEEAIERLKGARFDAVIIHLPLEQWDAEDLLEQIHRTQAIVPVIICDPEGTVADAVRFTKLGAFCFTKAEDPDEFKQILQWASEYSRSRDLANLGNAVLNEPWRKFLVGESRVMQQVMQVIRLVGKRKSTVLITGETGAGKEMVARAIHLASDRGNLPMVAVNCTALPENLLEAELFGHVKGAFTGAISHRVGRFEQAHRSTLFLDEVGDLPLDIQAKLLRVLQEREFQRIGSSETIKVDVRVIAASNMDLEQAVRQAKFREDLFYRLNVVPLRVPALRERPSDIPILVHHLIDKICSQEGLTPRKLARETLERLSHYSWPGNVRQLENAVEMAIALSGDRDALYPSDFPLPPSPRVESRAPMAFPAIALPDEGLDLTQIVENMERTILEQALRKTGGNKAQAAGMLRLKRTTLSAKLRSLSAARIA